MKKELEQEHVLDKIREEIMDMGAYEQEVHGKTEFLEGINYCLGVIDKYKAESKPKMGHWIIIDDCERFIAKCSECGRIEDSRMVNKYPYCHCGAKMFEQ